MSKITLAEAAHCERSGSYGWEGSTHVKGNQTGDELRFIDFYPYIGYNTATPWQYVFRPNDSRVANEIAIRMEQSCRNMKIGYSQPNRLDIFNALTKDPDPTHIYIAIDCDCSSLVNAVVYVTLKAYGFAPDIKGTEVTGQMPNAYKKSKYFTDVTSKVDLKTGNGLQRGDVLVRPYSHTAVCTSVEAHVLGPDKTPKWVAITAVDTACVYVDATGSTLLPQWPKLSKTNLVDVCDEVGGRYYVRIAGKYYGYVDKGCLAPNTPIRCTGTVTTALHLRKTPVSGASLCVMPKGAKIDIIAETQATTGATWYRAKYNGIEGYCSARYVKKD